MVKSFKINNFKYAIVRANAQSSSLVLSQDATSIDGTVITSIHLSIKYMCGLFRFRENETSHVQFIYSILGIN
jgi:hypothetical protein